MNQQLPPPAPANDPSATATTTGAGPTKRLTRSRDQRMIAGVAGGIAEYLQVDASIVRLIIVLIALLPGPAIVFYFAAWILMPEAEPTNPSYHRPMGDTPPPPPAAPVDPTTGSPGVSS